MRRDSFDDPVRYARPAVGMTASGGHKVLLVQNQLSQCQLIVDGICLQTYQNTYHRIVIRVISIIRGTFYDLQQVEDERVIHRRYTSRVSSRSGGEEN